MSEETQPTAAHPEPGRPPVPPAPPGPPAPHPGERPAAYAAPAPAGPRWRDRLFGLRALVAVALAGVVLGGLAGFGIHAATDGEGRDGRQVRFGPGGPGFRGGPDGGLPGPGPGFGQGPGQAPGQGQPPQPPQGAPSQAPTDQPSQDS